MMRLSRFDIAFAAALTLSSTAGATSPDADFSFETRDGHTSSLAATLASVSPDTDITLLLFDPDCNECHALMDSLRNDAPLAEAIDNRQAAVIAVFPVDETLPPDDPNMVIYHKVCGELPASWTVATDNGSILLNDACQWDNLPLLLKFKAEEFLDKANALTNND